MQFTAYQSIKNHYHQISVDTIKSLNLTDSSIEWVATEKIHGSNFCIISNGNDVFCGRRKAILEEDESFFNWRDIRDKYRDDVHQIYELTQSMFPGSGAVYIYGELYGGMYNHPDVQNEKCKAVQAGISYRPDIDFYPFDIKVEDVGYVSYDVFKELCQGRFLYATELKRGTFDECFDYDVEFETFIPAQLGLPLIENNIAEGIVLKPVIPAYTDEGERVILKKKHPNFSEVQSVPKKKKAPAKKGPSKIPDEAQAFVDIIELYITENRLRNVISKEGEIADSKKAKADLTNLFKEDVMSDFVEDHPEFNELDQNITRHITIYLSKVAPQLIGKNWNNITSGTIHKHKNQTRSTITKGNSQTPNLPR
eukprot:TRINITY_DN433_c1_g1_i1.p1 TRINITY_DN433_c1_g1~~TRINITY_DN433_c1_g1_i1.p1  ORF type:complete len:367 (+),score=76.92 TRINITY_DN433_c1_g1_i1:366-1466(+)